MLRTVCVLGILWLAGGCAASKEISSVVNGKEVITVLPANTPPVLRGDPIYNAEMATFLAELVLTEQGIDCRNRRILVSYSEGVYTVAFLSVEEESSASKFRVNIDADTSTVLDVTITEELKAADLDTDPA